MTRSQPNSSLVNFDPEIERTLLHTWQARRWLDYTASTLASFEEHTESLGGTESDLESWCTNCESRFSQFVPLTSKCTGSSK
ncbi:hypothetical protein AHAS_Ahas18G0196300 [Arachis hypogaea]